MNENIDLTKILKNCPTGFELYSSVYGKVKFVSIDEKYVCSWINVITENNVYMNFTSEGKLSVKHNGECVLFPSKDQRDWSKFTAHWYKREKFDPKTLQPFDKVLVSAGGEWQCDLFSHMLSGDIFNKRCIGVGDMNIVIPYNDDTKHLVGTKDEAPEFYRYWED